MALLGYIGYALAVVTVAIVILFIWYHAAGEAISVRGSRDARSRLRNKHEKCPCCQGLGVMNQEPHLCGAEHWYCGCGTQWDVWPDGRVEIRPYGKEGRSTSTSISVGPGA